MEFNYHLKSIVYEFWKTGMVIALYLLEMKIYRLQKSKVLRKAENMPINSLHETGKPIGLYFSFDFEDTAMLLLGNRYNGNTTDFMIKYSEYNLITCDFNSDRVLTISECELPVLLKEHYFNDYTFFCKELRKLHDAILITDLNNPLGYTELLVLNSSCIKQLKNGG